MEKNVINTDLTGKVAVVTGAGGVLCSYFAKVLARAGAKVALLDLNEESAQRFADEINAEGGCAKAYKCNVLDKDNCYAVDECLGKLRAGKRGGDIHFEELHFPSLRIYKEGFQVLLLPAGIFRKAQSFRNKRKQDTGHGTSKAHSQGKS